MKIDNYVRRKMRRRGYEKSVLPEVAEELYQNIIKEKNIVNPPTSIMDLFERLHKKDPENWELPFHLKPYIDKLELVKNEDVHTVVHSPSQVGKTLTTIVSLIYLAYTQKNFSSMYITYSAQRSQVVLLNNLIPILELLGIKHSKRENVVSIINIFGKKNYVYFTSIDGSITGYTIQAIVIDDYVKGPEDLTKNAKDKLQNWYLTTTLNRKSTKLSIIVIATRQANDDLSGRLIKDHDFEYIRIPAICDSENDLLGRQLGESIWPEKRPVKMYEDQRNEIIKATGTDNKFQLLWQGNTVTDGNALFSQNYTRYQEKFSTSEPIIVTYGLDMAYTDNKGDYSVCVRLITNKNSGITLIDDCIYAQIDYRRFIEKLVAFTKQMPGPVFWDIGTMEKPAAFEVRKAVNLQYNVITPGMTKFVRAGKSADAWNSGFLKVPLFLNENMKILIENVLVFTDGNHLGSDFTDALSAGYNPVANIRFQKHTGKPSPVDQQNKQFEIQNSELDKITKRAIEDRNKQFGYSSRNINTRRTI